MNRRATLITVLAICFAFAAFLCIRLLLLSSATGIRVSVSSRATQEEIMTPGSTGYSADRDIPTVNINTCSAEQLRLLPGIGPSLADSVISFRNENGPFHQPEDIMNVPGIGEGIYEQIRDHIIIEEQ